MKAPLSATLKCLDAESIRRERMYGVDCRLKHYIPKSILIIATIPADVVKDASFPFDRQKGEDVVVRIGGDRLTIVRAMAP